MENETLWNILMSIKFTFQIERYAKIKNKKTRKNFHFVHIDQYGWDGPQALFLHWFYQPRRPFQPFGGWKKVQK